MKEKDIITSGRVPEYLGFGQLDRQSFKQKNGKLFADYRLDDHLVHHIEADEKGVYIQDRFDDMILGQTTGKDLTSSFGQGFRSVNFQEDPRFDHIIRQAIHNGEVFVDYPDLHAANNSSILVPEGLAFELRLVIKPGTEKDHPQLNRAGVSAFEFPQHVEYPCKLIGLQDAQLFYLMDDGHIEIERVTTVHYHTILAFLPQAILSVNKAGYPSAIGSHRLRITDHIHRQEDTGLSICLAEGQTDYQAYGLISEELLHYYSRDQLLLAFKSLAQSKVSGRNEN